MNSLSNLEHQIQSVSRSSDPRSPTNPPAKEEIHQLLVKPIPALRAVVPASTRVASTSGKATRGTPKEDHLESHPRPMERRRSLQDEHEELYHDCRSDFEDETTGTTSGRMADRRSHRVLGANGKNLHAKAGPKPKSGKRGSGAMFSGETQQHAAAACCQLYRYRRLCSRRHRSKCLRVAASNAAANSHIGGQQSSNDGVNAEEFLSRRSLEILGTFLATAMGHQCQHHERYQSFVPTVQVGGSEYGQGSEANANPEDENKSEMPSPENLATWVQMLQLWRPNLPVPKLGMFFDAPPTTQLPFYKSAEDAESVKSALGDLPESPRQGMKFCAELLTKLAQHLFALASRPPHGNNTGSGLGAKRTKDQEIQATVHLDCNVVDGSAQCDEVLMKTVSNSSATNAKDGHALFEQDIPDVGNIDKVLGKPPRLPIRVRLLSGQPAQWSTVDVDAPPPEGYVHRNKVKPSKTRPLTVTSPMPPICQRISFNPGDDLFFRLSEICLKSNKDDELSVTSNQNDQEDRQEQNLQKANVIEIEAIPQEVSVIQDDHNCMDTVPEMPSTLLVRRRCTDVLSLPAYSQDPLISSKDSSVAGHRIRYRRSSPPVSYVTRTILDLLKETSSTSANVLSLLQSDSFTSEQSKRNLGRFLLKEKLKRILSDIISERPPQKAGTSGRTKVTPASLPSMLVKKPKHTIPSKQFYSYQLDQEAEHPVVKESLPSRYTSTISSLAGSAGSFARPETKIEESSLDDLSSHYNSKAVGIEAMESEVAELKENLVRSCSFTVEDKGHRIVAPSANRELHLSDIIIPQDSCSFSDTARHHKLYKSRKIPDDKFMDCEESSSREGDDIIEITTRIDISNGPLGSKYRVYVDTPTIRNATEKSVQYPDVGDSVTPVVLNESDSQTQLIEWRPCLTSSYLLKHLDFMAKT